LLRKSIGSITFITLSVGLLIFSSILDYYFFMIFVELITIFLGLMIFIIAFYSKEYTKDNNLLYVGIAYLSLAFLDFMHIFDDWGFSALQNNVNAQGQLWIAARATEAYILFYAFSKSSWKRRFNFKHIFISFSVTTFFIVLLVVLNDFLPKIYTVEYGYNLYKKSLDILIIVMFIIALFNISKNEKRTYNKIILILAVLFKISSEIIFIFETGDHGVLEAVRHILKYISYIFLFHVFVKDLLQRPYENIFRAFEKKERELTELTKRDSLTKLYNHSTSYEMMRSIIKDNERNNENLCLMMIDVDDFKAINDKFGHVKGDEILSKIGQLFLTCEGPIRLAGRYGGDEFVVLFSNIDYEKTKILAAKIFKRMDELSNEVGIKVTLSIGVSLWKSGLTAKDLVKLADKQMYNAKDVGKNTFSIETKSE